MYLFENDNKCYNPCPDPYYGDNIDSLCKECNEYCESCFGPNISECNSCVDGSSYFFDSNDSSCKLE